MDHQNFQVVDQPTDGRYELHHDDEVVGFATYRLTDSVLTIPHVETLARHRGNGFADILMGGIVDDARRRGLTIRPLCPFAADFMRADATTHDLIAN